MSRERLLQFRVAVLVALSSCATLASADSVAILATGPKWGRWTPNRWHCGFKYTFRRVEGEAEKVWRVRIGIPERPTNGEAELRVKLWDGSPPKNGDFLVVPADLCTTPLEKQLGVTLETWVDWHEDGMGTAFWADGAPVKAQEGASVVGTWDCGKVRRTFNSVGTVVGELVAGDGYFTPDPGDVWEQKGSNVSWLACFLSRWYEGEVKGDTLTFQAFNPNGYHDDLPCTLAAYKARGPRLDEVYPGVCTRVK